MKEECSYSTGMRQTEATLHTCACVFVGVDCMCHVLTTCADSRTGTCFYLHDCVYRFKNCTLPCIKQHSMSSTCSSCGNVYAPIDIRTVEGKQVIDLPPLKQAPCSHCEDIVIEWFRSSMSTLRSALYHFREPTDTEESIGKTLKQMQVGILCNLAILKAKTSVLLAISML